MDGAALGTDEGCDDGWLEGCEEGCDDGWLEGMVDIDGASLGMELGWLDGSSVVEVGAEDTDGAADTLGYSEGMLDG